MIDYVITPYQEDWTVRDRYWASTVRTDPEVHTRLAPATHDFEEPDVETSRPFTCVSNGRKGGVIYAATFTSRVDAVPAPDLPAGLDLPSLEAEEYTMLAGHWTEAVCLGPAPTTTATSDAAATTSPDGTATTTTAATTTTTPDHTATTTTAATTTTSTTTTTVPSGMGAGTGVDHPPFEPVNEDIEGASVGIACGRIPGVGAGVTVTIEVEGGGASGTHTGITDADGAFRIPFGIEFFDVIRWSVVSVTGADGTAIDTPQLGGELEVGDDDVACVNGS